MAGDNPKPSSSNKRPPSSSSSDRKSRWESSKPTTTTTTATASVSDPKPPTQSSSNKPTPKRGTNPNPNPNPSPAHPNPSPARAPGPHPPFPFPDPGPPPPPSYGFHMLDRRTIVLADGSVRSYFALPPDYQDFTPPPPRPPLGPPMGRLMPPLGPMSPEGFRDRERERGQDYWQSLAHEGRGGPEGSMKRKFGEGEERERERERDELARQRQHLLQYGNVGASLGTGTSSPFGRDDEFRSSKYMRSGGGVGSGGGFENNLGMMMMMRQEVDPAVFRACLKFMKLINENSNQKKNLENGKSIQCLACDRSSKDFQDVHALIMHTYNSDNAELRVDHLGFHRALCVVMGWNYLRPPDNSRAYQFLPADEAAANQDDLILWPPMVIIHNTNTGKGKDGRMEGLGNKTMDNKLRELGILGGKSKSLYSREGHLGITLIKFASDQSGLKEAMRLADHFERDRHGRRAWAHVQSATNGKDDESNPNIVMVDERTGDKRRILYGYLGTAFDLDKLDYDSRKKVVIESKYEKLQPPKPT